MCKRGFQQTLFTETGRLDWVHGPTLRLRDLNGVLRATLMLTGSRQSEDPVTVKPRTFCSMVEKREFSLLLDGGVCLRGLRCLQQAENKEVPRRRGREEEGSLERCRTSPVPEAPLPITGLPAITHSFLICPTLRTCLTAVSVQASPA